MIYVYFISYHIDQRKNGSWGFGNVEIQRDKQITTMEDIRSIEKLINENYHNKVLIINYQLLRKYKGEL